MKDWPRSYWIWGAGSHPGARVEQQDRWRVFTLAGGNGLLAMVADGMGGHRDGALGAQGVVNATEQFVRNHAGALRDNPAEALTILCQHAHQVIVSVSAAAHSTMVALWLYQDQARWMHVGDSRLYHFRNGRRLVRTRDHSVAQMLVDLGEISEAEMASHPDQNRLYRSLGGEQQPKVEIGGSQVIDDDLFVLCSDGVWEHISDEELCAAAYSKSLAAAANDLVKQATVRGGPKADNASLILIRPAPPHTRPHSWLRRLFGGD